MVLRRFLKDRRGSVAPMFALAIVPVIGLTGAAIDYSRANSMKVGMQAALDSTSLAMAKLAPTLTATQLQTQANAYFQALFNSPEAKNVSITTAYATSNGAQLTITGSGSMDTTFMKVMGYQSLNFGSSSTVKWGMSRMRVALALDNTGSMNDAGKIGALKTATKSLLTQLKGAASNNGDIYVSIIPFSRDVNASEIGTYSSNWIRWAKTGSDTDSWDDNNGSCSGGWGWGWGSSNKSNCSGTWTADNQNTWNGCIMDRDQNYDVTNTAPSAATPATLFPAQQYVSCPVAMMGLTYDWTALNNKVDAMYANGNTNQPDERRPEHAESLDHQPVDDRHTAENHVRQRQGGWHHALYDPREHGQRSDLDGAAVLRERQEQVLYRDFVVRTHRSVQPDWHEPVAAAHLEMTIAAGQAWLAAFLRQFHR
jgi:Flp pilus assembly protein TadG